MGTNTYGGIPFDVEGTVQLMGRVIYEFKEKIYPVKIEHIRIDQRCGRIHLLHGASFLAEGATGIVIAKLVLHYADGGKAELNIVAGEHVLDWWGPLYTTGADPGSIITASQGTTLAWAGSNPWIERQQPGWSLRLYKSTFENPQPAKVLSSIDYVSTMTSAAPFLAGITLQ
jgi:hypothetical protein